MAKAATLDAEAIGIKEETPFTIVMRRFRKHRLAMIAAVVMVLIFLVSLFARQISPFLPDEIDVGSYFLQPGSYEPVENGVRQHVLGTDQIGRDYFSRLLYAARISLTVALTSVFISTLIGMVIGAISGFLGGTVDAVLMRAPPTSASGGFLAGTCSRCSGPKSSCLHSWIPPNFPACRSRAASRAAGELSCRGTRAVLGRHAEHCAPRPQPRLAPQPSGG